MFYLCKSLVCDPSLTHGPGMFILDQRTLTLASKLSHRKEGICGSVLALNTPAGQREMRKMTHTSGRCCSELAWNITPYP